MKEYTFDEEGWLEWAADNNIDIVEVIIREQ